MQKEYFIDVQGEGDDLVYAIFSIENGMSSKLEAVYYTKSKAEEDLAYMKYMDKKRNVVKITRKN